MSQGKKNEGKFKQNRDGDSKRMSGGCCVVRLLMPLCCVVRIFMSLCTPDDDEGGGGGGGRVCCTSDNELSKFCSLYIRFESPYLDFRRTSLYFSWLVTFRKEMLEFSAAPRRNEIFCYIPCFHRRFSFLALDDLMRDKEWFDMAGRRGCHCIGSERG